MFSSKEACRVAAAALEAHVGPEAAESFRTRFEPNTSDLVPPPRDLVFDPFYAHEPARLTRLLHVQSPEILHALSKAAVAGDESALELITDVVRNPDGDTGARTLALSIFARYMPAEAGDLAVSLSHDEKMSHQLGESLIRGSRSPELVPALERLARHDDPLTHRGAIEALLELGEHGSEALARCLVASNEEVRHAAGYAVMRQNLATPAILAAVDEGLRRFDTELDRRRFPQLKEQLEGSGFRWEASAVAKHAIEQLDRLDHTAPSPKYPLLARLRSLLAPPPKEELPESGLLDWHRAGPLTKEETVAQSLVKLVVLRPHLMTELAEFNEEDESRPHRIGTRGIDEIELWRGEQRDARLFVPFAAQLTESPDFRARVRRLLDEISG